MAIEPDTKDWTWVLRERCPECGLLASDVPAHDVAARVRRLTRDWNELLAADDVRRRPDERTWSPLEYGAHVRDVLRIADRRIERMLTEEDPLLENWDQDATAVEERYDLQDPGTVRAELGEAAEALASRLDAVPASSWLRTCRRTDGAVFTVGSFAQYVLHDVHHHVWDVSGARP